MMPKSPDQPNIGSSPSPIDIQQPGRIRIIVRPVRNWHHAQRRFIFGGLILATIATLAAISAFPIGPDSIGMIVPVSMYFLAALLLLYISLNRSYRSILLDITAERFVMRQVNLFGINEASWPRTDVIETRVNSINQKLILRFQHQESLEIYLGPDRAANEDVAKRLIDAISHPPIENVKSPNPFVHPSFWQKRMLIGVAMALLIAGAVVLIVSSVPAIGVVLIFLSCFPAGWALGSQDRAFYI